MGAHERLLGEAMRGDPSLFARQDAVEAAWAILDPILGDITPCFSYAKRSWGPAEARRLTARTGGWVNPVSYEASS